MELVFRSLCCSLVHLFLLSPFPAGSRGRWSGAWCLWGSPDPQGVLGLSPPPFLQSLWGFSAFHCIPSRLPLELRSPFLRVRALPHSGDRRASRSGEAAVARPHGVASLTPQLCVSLSLQCIVRILPRALRKAR